MSIRRLSLPGLERAEAPALPGAACDALLDWARDLFQLQRTTLLNAAPGPGISLARYAALALPPADAANLTLEKVASGI